MAKRRAKKHSAGESEARHEPIRVIFRGAVHRDATLQWVDDNAMHMNLLAKTKGAISSTMFVHSRVSSIGNDFVGDPDIVEKALCDIFPFRSVRRTPHYVETGFGVGTCFVVTR